MKQKQPHKEEKRTSLSKTLLEINKRYGKTVIGTASSMGDVLKMEYISTGVEVLDIALGGGFLKGRIVEMYGIPAAGKSVISLLTIKQAQDEGLDCILVDVEKSFDVEFAKKFGINTEKLIVINLSVGEEIVDTVAKLLSAHPGVIVIDSLAAMVPKGEMEKDAEEPTMALKARIMSRGLARLNALNKKSLLIWINQMRSTLEMYGAKVTTPGGRSLSHYASTRIEVKAGEKLTGKNKDDIIGQVIQCYISKNKAGQPHRRCSFKLWYNPIKIE